MWRCNNGGVFQTLLGNVLLHSGIKMPVSTQQKEVPKKMANENNLTCVSVTSKTVSNVSLAARAFVRAKCVCAEGTLITVMSLLIAFIEI